MQRKAGEVGCGAIEENQELLTKRDDDIRVDVNQQRGLATFEMASGSSWSKGVASRIEREVVKVMEHKYVRIVQNSRFFDPYALKVFCWFCIVWALLLARFLFANQIVLPFKETLSFTPGLLLLPPLAVLLFALCARPRESRCRLRVLIFVAGAMCVAAYVACLVVIFGGLKPGLCFRQCPPGDKHCGQPRFLADRKMPAPQYTPAEVLRTLEEERFGRAPDLRAEIVSLPPARYDPAVCSKAAGYCKPSPGRCCIEAVLIFGDDPEEPPANKRGLHEQVWETLTSKEQSKDTKRKAVTRIPYYVMYTYPQGPTDTVVLVNGMEVVPDAFLSTMFGTAARLGFWGEGTDYPPYASAHSVWRTELVKAGWQDSHQTGTIALNGRMMSEFMKAFVASDFFKESGFKKVVRQACSIAVKASIYELLLTPSITHAIMGGGGALGTSMETVRGPCAETKYGLADPKRYGVVWKPGLWKREETLDADDILEALVKVGKHVLIHVAKWDLWANPMGTVAAYRSAYERLNMGDERQRLQLLLTDGWVHCGSFDILVDTVPAWLNTGWLPEAHRFSMSPKKYEFNQAIGFWLDGDHAEANDQGPLSVGQSKGILSLRNGINAIAWDLSSFYWDDSGGLAYT